MTVLFYAFIISLTGTVVILGIGLGSFFVGGAFNEKYANRLMQLRVVFQGLTLGLFALLLFLGGR